MLQVHDLPRNPFHSDQELPTNRVMYKRILVPIDGSDSAIAGLREVPRIASQPELMVLLIHVIEQSGWNEQFHPGTVGEIIQDAPRKEGSDLLDAAKSTLSSLGIPCEAILAESHNQRTSEVIVTHAALRNADLIVMGTHGRRGVRRALLGSDAAEVVSLATIPVLLVRIQADGPTVD
jgi:nucleotide-binding universal stress UspA family protein